MSSPKPRSGPYLPCKKPKNPNRPGDPGGASKPPGYIDEETLNRMMESFGSPEEDYEAVDEAAVPVEEHIGPPTAAWQTSTPLPPPQEITKKKPSPRTPDGRYVLPGTHVEAEPKTPGAAEQKKESLLEWFDRSVEKELQKRRDPSLSPATAADPALAPLKAKHALNLSKGAAERIAETSASGVEITSRLESDFTSELSDAVEKLAKAETMCTYAEALQAAEEAAQNAPPELAEQAAAAEARRIQTEVSEVKHTIPGIRPIEVVGYVGITKPHHPKRPV